MIILILLAIFALGCSVTDNLDLPMMPPGMELSKNELPPPEPDTPEDPPEFYGEPIPSENNTIAFVIDRSCSMAISNNWINDDGTIVYGKRIDRAKVELKKCISSLPKTFKFNIFAYDCTIYRWRPKLTRATMQNKMSAFAWSDAHVFASGGTGTGPAVVTALQDRDTRSIILLTDGAPGCGGSSVQSHRWMIKTGNTQNAKIDVFGIDVSYYVFKSFCQGIASDNNGVYIDMN